MTDEAKALVERLRYTEEHGIFTAHDNGMQAMPGEAADLIETQAREIGRLRLALGLIAVFGPEAVAGLANQALAGDSHDQ